VDDRPLATRSPLILPYAMKQLSESEISDGVYGDEYQESGEAPKSIVLGREISDGILQVISPKAVVGFAADDLFSDSGFEITVTLSDGSVAQTYSVRERRIDEANSESQNSKSSAPERGPDLVTRVSPRGSGGRSFVEGEKLPGSGQFAPHSGLIDILHLLGRAENTGCFPTLTHLSSADGRRSA